MKESGINYFFNSLGLNSGSWDILYTFEENAGTVLDSISGAQSQYSAVLSNNTNFWQKPGSGYFNGFPAVVSNASGAFSNFWTMVFSYEKTSANGGILFSNLNTISGFEIGITDSNKVYFKTPTAIVCSSNNYSSKNLVTFSYLPNYLTIGYYNFTSQNLEQEFFNFNFNVQESDNWHLGPSYTGYMDYFMYFSTYYDGNTLSELFSGLYNIPTGTGYNITSYTTSGITGFQNIILTVTGVTGYRIAYDLNGYPDYLGVFPSSGIVIPLVGVISSTTQSLGLTGLTTFNNTGNQITLFNNLTGYSSSFGMQKVQILQPYIQNNDILKDSYNRTPYNYVYNNIGVFNYTGFYLNSNYSTGQLNIFLNGLAQANSGFYITGNYLVLTGCDVNDILIFDLQAGSKQMFNTSTLQAYPFVFTGQELFLNGVNLVSGYDFNYDGANIYLTTRNSGVSGYIFEYPVGLAYTTGNYSFKTGSLFDKDGANIYLNGIRLLDNIQYIEGAVFDNYSGNYYNNLYQTQIYDDNNNYWSTF